MGLFGSKKPNIKNMLEQKDVSGLIDVLRGKDPHNYRAVVEALVKIGDIAVEPLIAALKDKEPGVRKGAYEALGDIGDTRVFEPIKATINSETDIDVLEVACMAMINLEVASLPSEFRNNAGEAAAGVVYVSGDILVELDVLEQGRGAPDEGQDTKLSQEDIEKIAALDPELEELIDFENMETRNSSRKPSQVGKQSPALTEDPFTVTEDLFTARFPK